MAINNLRVIWNNIADLSTVTASTTANTASATLSTSSITGTTLTVGTVVGTIAVGMYLTGTGVINGTYIVSGSGTSWVVSQNHATTTGSITITALTTATPVSNLLIDKKALVWRSNTTTATLTISFGSSKTIRGIVLPFTNLTSTATINVTCTGGSTATTGNVSQIFTNSSDTTYLPTGASTYSYGGGVYGRAWFSSAQTCTGCTVTIVDTNNTAGYIEASRLIIGDAWIPTFNTSFGLTYGPRSLSTNNRTEAGDLVTNRGIQYNSMSFDLTYLNPTDRATFTKILKTNGINKGLLISLFPDASEDYDKEQTWMIYGKLTSMSDITHTMHTMYSSKVEIEEI